MRIFNKYIFIQLLLSSTFLFTVASVIAQQKTEVKKQIVKGFEVETGYFSNGQPYAKMGNGNKILLNIEALSFEHKPPEGFLLKQFVKHSKPFIDDYTVYLVGRKPNLPDNYLFERMAENYALLLKDEFKKPVDLMGISTGGQISMHLAAGYPEYINKVVIISAAFRISEEGEKIERKAAEYFEQEKYGKTMATIMELIYDKGIKLGFYKSLMHIFGPGMLKNVEYPNDFQVEIRADREMNFYNRLNEIKAPTLIIAGEKDIAYSLEDIKATSEGIPNSHLLLYEDYGHDLIMANNKEVSKKIIEFLVEKEE
jgi:pimeloyl-ACP methyl ester carboxylesterase